MIYNFIIATEDKIFEILELLDTGRKLEILRVILMLNIDTTRSYSCCSVVAVNEHSDCAVIYILPDLFDTLIDIHFYIYMRKINIDAIIIFWLVV